MTTAAVMRPPLLGSVAGGVVTVSTVRTGEVDGVARPAAQAAKQ
jgi:hypothetical protein